MRSTRSSSAFHAAAAALVDRAAGIAQFTDAAAKRADVDALRHLIHVVHDEEIESQYPEKYGSRVSITLGDGRHLETTCLDPFGSRARPPSQEQLDGKFLTGAASCFDEHGASEFLTRLRHLDETDDIGEIYDVRTGR